MTAVTALSILRGTKRGMKVKDNFTFFLHRWSPWGSLGNPGEARSRPRQVGDAQETGVCTQGGDGLGLGLGSGSGSNTSHVWHPCSLSPVSSSTTRKSSRCRGGRGLKGVGLKDRSLFNSEKKLWPIEVLPWKSNSKVIPLFIFLWETMALGEEEYCP